MSGRARIALTIGDPNGIGPEIAVKAARALRDRPEIDVVLVGDAFVIDDCVRRFSPDAAPAIAAVDALARDDFRPGEVRPGAGRATVAYVREAVALMQRGDVSAIVAAPHSETAVNAAGIAFSGYPQLLAEILGCGGDQVFLMLCGGGLRIVHATLHERLAGAIARLTPEIVCAAASAAATALHAFGLRAPRIGVFGINPHGSEGGLFGPEDSQITIPAVAALRAQGIDAHGPAGADVMLAQRDCDAYVAMYHDQGHIPVKLLAGRDSAALSIGAGIVFSSVGHGSAFDIAGRGIADPAPLLHTIGIVASLQNSAVTA